MLISRRKEGETLLIGENIEIRIVAIRKKKVILGVIAPRDVKISTGKLADIEMANTLAAVTPSNVDDLLPNQRTSTEDVLFFLERRSSTETDAPTTDKTLRKPE